jgi:hypothetical protein
MSLDPVIGLLIVGAFAILFASAALHKFGSRSQFEAVFAAYELLPRSLRRYGARALPWLELGVALGLLAGASRPLAALIGAALLLAYALAIAVNLRRGRHELACGCGGVQSLRPIAAWMVWRNAALALVLSTALWPWTSRGLWLTDALTITGGVGASVLIYLCLEELGQLARRVRDLPGSR